MDIVQGANGFSGHFTDLIHRLRHLNLKLGRRRKYEQTYERKDKDYIPIDINAGVINIYIAINKNFDNIIGTNNPQKDVLLSKAKRI